MNVDLFRILIYTKVASTRAGCERGCWRDKCINIAPSSSANALSVEADDIQTTASSSLSWQFRMSPIAKVLFLALHSVLYKLIRAEKKELQAGTLKMLISGFRSSFMKKICWHSTGIEENMRKINGYLNTLSTPTIIWIPQCTIISEISEDLNFGISNIRYSISQVIFPITHVCDDVHM